MSLWPRITKDIVFLPPGWPSRRRGPAGIGLLKTNAKNAVLARTAVKNSVMPALTAERETEKDKEKSRTFDQLRRVLGPQSERAPDLPSKSRRLPAGVRQGGS